MFASSPLGRRPKQTVVCIACGEELRRSEAREYDKYGNRWTRGEKRFEFLCKPCYKHSCKQSRDGLESTLIRANAGNTDEQSFLRNYCSIISDDQPRESNE